MNKTLVALILIFSFGNAEVNKKEYKVKLMKYIELINKKTVVGFKCTDNSGDYALFRNNIKLYETSNKFYFKDSKNMKMFDIEKCMPFGRVKLYYK